MPHQCTTCGHVFHDGSTEMLSGCPDCGGNAFQFHPEAADVPDDPPDVEPPDGDGGVGGRVGRAASTVRDMVAGQSSPPTVDESDPPSPAATWPDEHEDAAQAAARGSTTSEGPPTGEDIIVADEEATHEDAAQTEARSDVATTADLPADDAGSRAPPPDGEAAGTAGDRPPTESDAPPAPDRGRVVSTPTGETPDLAELREQLNEQFESIKIVEPGQYELNLMELYEREEYIIALQENGRYVIQMPETWMADPEAE